MGILYTQAGRRFISTSLPVRMLLTMVRRDSIDKKQKSDPGTHRNRPLDTKHVRDIAEYLRNEAHYLLPPIMLNAASHLQVFAVKTQVATKPCVVVLPPEEYLYVTDGQHRLEALKTALSDRPDLEQDAIGVTIVEEGDIYKVHQDFFDAAQVMPLAKSLLVEYDGRAPLNWITRRVCAEAEVLGGRVERISNSIGKTSLMLFTTNQVKQGILQLVVGDWSLYAAQMQKQAEQMLAVASELWYARVVNFLNEFTQRNEQWRHVKDRPLETGMSTDIPKMREEFLHFSGGGLLVLCGVGHAIMQMGPEPDGVMSPEQNRLVYELANLDWSRRGSLWAGNLVGSQGNITPHKNNVALAVGKVKRELNLPVTDKEEALIRRSSESRQAVVVG